MKVCTVDSMRKMDRKAVEHYGIRSELLMENAGHAAYLVIHREIGIRGLRFAVICGSGNNGGDGLVVARKLHSMGGLATVYLPGDEAKFQGTGRLNLEIAQKIPLSIKRIDDLKTFKAGLSECDCIVDAIFGTGLAREVKGIYGEIIGLINESGKKVFSIDIPSGVNGDNGGIMGHAVRADCTITFGLPKLGNLLFPGFSLGGRLYLTHISFPPALTKNDELTYEINQPVPLPARDPNAHKGKLGDLLTVAGASTYYGAPYFSAYSFLKAGGGYSRLAAPASMIPGIAAKGNEIVFVPQSETSSGSLSSGNLDGLIELSKKVDMVVLGPGVSRNPDTQDLVRHMIEAVGKPLIIDGDGLYAAASNREILKQRSSPTILTPHPGEMAQLTGKTIKDVEGDRVQTTITAAKELGCFIVLKGAHSLIASPRGRLWINMSGNSGMATAGSGDVLTGTIAAMLGQGLPVEEAIKTGVFLHGLAGDLASDDKGEDGITAQDILDYLPPAVKRYRELYRETLENCYGSIFTI